jgi:PAS domain S-box-containing protein
MKSHYSEKEISELQNEIIYNVSQSVVSSVSLDDFFRTVSLNISRLIPACKLYVFLIDNGNLHYGYCSDSQEFSDCLKHCEKGICEYVLNTGKPVLMDKARYQKLLYENHWEDNGILPAYWMGVPLRANNSDIGVMFAFIPDESPGITPQIMNIIVLIANHVAVAIYKKTIEEQLVQQNDFVNSLMSSFPDLIYLKDTDSRFIKVSNAFARRLCLNHPDEIVGKTDFDIYNEAHAREAFEDEQQIIRTGIPVIGKEELEIWPNGEKRWSYSTKMPWHNAKGKVMGTFGISTDITRLKKVEESLRNNQSVLENILNAIPQSVFWKDTESIYLGCNSVFAKAAGFANPSEIIGKSDYDLPWTSREVETYRASDAEIIRTGQPLMHIIETMQKADGQKIWIETSKIPLKDENGKVYGILGVYDDITLRKKAEEDLQESRRKLAETIQMLQLVIDTIPVRVFWKTKESVFLGCNKLFAADAGMDSPDKLIGKTDFDMNWREQAEQYVADDRTVIETGIPKLNYEEKQTTPKGYQIWLRTSKVPLRNIDNEIIGVLGTYDDITPLKEKEEKLQAINAELEKFSYTVSHDLRSPLFTIKGFIGLLKEDVESGNLDSVYDNISKINTAADKMASLLNNLLELSRVGRFTNPFIPVNMDKVVKDALESVSGIINEKKVKLILPEKMPRVQADPQRMAEVWQNLIENAVKFMGNQPVPVIEIGYSNGEKDVEFFIRDNGIGIDPKYHDTIFGLFNKLDNKSEGTGFGLALVKRIIEVHGGIIWVESDGRNKGCTFKFKLPLKKHK